MPGGFDQGMGDCVQREMVNNVEFFKNSDYCTLNGEHVNKVSVFCFAAKFQQLSMNLNVSFPFRRVPNSKIDLRIRI